MQDIEMLNKPVILEELGKIVKQQKPEGVLIGVLSSGEC